jgi:acetolactate synthase-1/2/3 large subunit
MAYSLGRRHHQKPQYVVETLWNMTKDASQHATSDVGTASNVGSQYYKFDEPRRWINSGGLGTMGVAFLCDGDQIGQSPNAGSFASW